MRSFDLVVIGGGSAGYAAARTAKQAGLGVAVIEGGPQVGGLCILRGCMPTKALLEAAHRLHEIRRAGIFGLNVGSIEVDVPRMIERKNRLIEKFARYRQEQLEDGRFTLIRGKARFLSPHRVEVDWLDGRGAEQIEAKGFIVATGSVVSSVEIPGLCEAGFITSDDAIHLTELPRRLVVLGGGAIAVEFAQYFLHLGVEVTLIQRSPHILKKQDPAVAAVVEKVFRDQGMTVFTGTKLFSVERSERGVKTVVFEHQGSRHWVEADEILFALGRTPALDGLEIQAAGLEKDGAYLRVNRMMQTTQPHIFAAGDVCGPFEVVHTAIEQGEKAARNLARVLRGESSFEEMDYRLKTEVIFTEPEVASVGMTEHEARQAGLDVLVAVHPLDDHGKSLVMEALDGFVKLVALRKTGEIVGAQMVSPRASDMIHELIAVMFFRGTAAQLARLPHYHPTLAEIITYPAEEIADQVG